MDFPMKFSARGLIDNGKNSENVTTFGMGYNLDQYSPLNQINKSNVKRLVPIWSTSLANEAARKQALIPTGQFCQQSTEMLKLASTLDTKGFHDYVIAHEVDGVHPKCSK